MRLSALLITSAIVVSANATSFKQHRMSEPMEICQNKLNKATSDLSDLKDAVSKFTSNGGYLTALRMHLKEQKFEYTLSETNDACCRDLNVDISNEESRTGINIISSLIDNAIDTLTIVGEKKSEFDNTLLITFMVENDIKSIERHTKSLLECFVQKTSKEHHSSVRDISSRLLDSLSLTKSLFGI